MAAPRVFLRLGGVDATAGAAPAGVAWLSVPERLRLQHMQSPLRRAQFIAGRWLLRLTLAEAFGRSPTDWCLSAGEAEAPTCLQPLEAMTNTADTAVHLALSHSANQVCCAVGNRPVGIDIEAMRRERDWPSLAELVFTPAEWRRWSALPSGLQQANFHTLWTLKEAWIKSAGRALSPALLARIHTEPLPNDALPGTANAHVWRADDFVMALVMSAHADHVWTGEAPAVAKTSTPWMVGESVSLGADGRGG